MRIRSTDSERLSERLGYSNKRRLLLFSAKEDAERMLRFIVESSEFLKRLDYCKVCKEDTGRKLSEQDETLRSIPESEKHVEKV